LNSSFTAATAGKITGELIAGESTTQTSADEMNGAVLKLILIILASFLTTL
jgi:hypothetical protein